MLLAEEFVLLALDPGGTLARSALNHFEVAVGVTGALVTELVQQGHVAIVDDRVEIIGTRPAHPLLAQVLDNVDGLRGKKLRSRLGSIKHSGWGEVIDSMTTAGILGREDHALKPTRHPVIDRASQETLLAQVRSAAVGDGPMDARTATLLALAGPCQMLEVVAPDRKDHKVAKRRIAEATDQVPAAAAVKAVISDMTATMMAAAISVSGSS